MKGSKSSINIRGIILVIVFIMVLAIVCFISGVLWMNSKNVDIEETPVITSELISQRLQSVSELATVKYFYTNMGKFEEGKTFYGIDIPFSKKGFILSYDGIVNAGIDMGKMNIAVDSDNYQIIVILPEAEILSHSIDENSVKLFDESKNIFNQISITDYTEFISSQREEIEERAVQRGLLTEAKDKARLIIQNILTLSEDIYMDYEIIFE